MNKFHKIETIHNLHDMMGLGKPKHPLISVVDFSKSKDNYSSRANGFIIDMYAVILKNQLPGDVKYGRKAYDFQEGTLMFIVPGQTMTIEPTETSNEYLEGWGLFFHPDLLLRSAFLSKIDDYGFLSYDLNESLQLSEKEKVILSDTVQRIDEELSENIDTNSQPLIISNIELLLNYCSRFYGRQFITRSNFESNNIVDFKKYLREYFKAEIQKDKGLPSVNYFAEKLHLSPKYFSDMVKSETGRNAMGHIHDYILELAKSKLLNSNDSVSEIAYFLGFEYPQYFSKMFKKKLGVTPAEYRSLN